MTGAQADLNALDQKIQAPSGNADASLHDKRAALDQKLTDVKNATQDNWNDAKIELLNEELAGNIRRSLRGSRTMKLI